MPAIAGYLRNRKQHPCSCSDIEELVRGAKNFNDWGLGAVFFGNNFFDVSPIILSQDR